MQTIKQTNEILKYFNFKFQSIIKQVQKILIQDCYPTMFCGKTLPFCLPLQIEDNQFLRILWNLNSFGSK